MNKYEFINKIVFGYIRKDLEAIKANIPRKSGEPGNCNFPIALCVLAYMEYLGGYITGLDRNFKKNVETYLGECFPNPTEYNVLLLKDIFRNGLAHEYFARGGIARDGVRPPLYRDHNNEVILDADTLLDDFLISLSNFNKILTNEQYIKGKELAEESIKKRKSERKDEIDKLPSNSDIRSFSTSGATTYPKNITRPYDPNE